MTTRELLQSHGTMMKTFNGDDYWLDQLKEEILNVPHQIIIISDLRLISEH